MLTAPFVRKVGDKGTFGVQLSQWPQDTFLFVSSSCCPGSILLLLQQVLLGPALGIMLPQGWDLQDMQDGLNTTSRAPSLAFHPVLQHHPQAGMLTVRHGVGGGERVEEMKERHLVGLGFVHLVMLSLIVWWLQQLFQDSDLLVSKISTVWLH